jgi:hypothetical protein
VNEAIFTTQGAPLQRHMPLPFGRPAEGDTPSGRGLIEDQDDGPSGARGADGIAERARRRFSAWSRPSAYGPRFVKGVRYATGSPVAVPDLHPVRVARRGFRAP